MKSECEISPRIHIWWYHYSQHAANICMKNIKSSTKNNVFYHISVFIDNNKMFDKH